MSKFRISFRQFVETKGQRTCSGNVSRTILLHRVLNLINGEMLVAHSRTYVRVHLYAKRLLLKKLMAKEAL